MKNRKEETMGMRIKECRAKMGITQEELADILYLKKTTVSAYENDKIDIKISVLKDLAKVLHTTVSYLVEGIDFSLDEEAMRLLYIYQKLGNEKIRIAAVKQMTVLLEMD